VIPIKLPALRQRRDDIILLVDHFLKRHAQGGKVKIVSKEAMEAFLKYDWPGNVRELENVMERSLILDESGTVNPEDLPDKIRFGHSQRGTLFIDSPTLTLEELEKEYFLKVLNHTRWRRSGRGDHQRVHALPQADRLRNREGNAETPLADFGVDAA
jgi:DNA-binding NtrC family response regulator